MVWPYIIGAAGIGYLLSRSDKDHDDVVEETLEQLEDAAADDATIFADHVDRDDIPNTRGAFTHLDDEPDHHPDVVVKSGIDNSLIVEVETGDALENNGGEAKDQIDDFSISGYRRVLVVPGADFDSKHVKEFSEDLDEQLSGNVYLATPSGVTDLL